MREPEEAVKVLSTALSLRAEWERLLLAQLGQNSRGGESASSGVSRKAMEKLSDGLVRFLLYTEVLLLGCDFRRRIIIKTRAIYL